MRAIAGLFDTPVPVRKVIEELSAEGFDPQLVSVFTNSPSTGTGVRTGETSEEALTPPIDEPAADVHSGGVTREPTLPLPNAPLTTGPRSPDEPKQALPHDPKTDREVKTSVGKLPGGLHNALVSWGFSKHDIREYENAVKRGRVLVVVELTDDQMAARATAALRSRGVDRMVFRGYSPASTG
jgi:hypothetical protein